jgi:hypothetical protein
LGKQIYGTVGNKHNYYLVLGADLHIGTNPDGSNYMATPTFL